MKYFGFIKTGSYSKPKQEATLAPFGELFSGCFLSMNYSMKSKRRLDRTGSQKPGFYDNSSLSPADLEKPGFFLEGNLRLGGAGF